MADEFSKTKAPVAVLEYEPSAFEQALLKHKSKLVLVAVLGVAGSLGYWGYKLVKESGDKSAGVAFMRAGTVEELKKVASEHSGKPAGGSALIHAAQKMSADNPADAAALLKTFLDEYPDHPLRSAATFRRGEYLAIAGNAEAARTEYEALASTDSPEAGFALLRLGDLAWGAGDTAKAKEHYDKLTSSAAFSGSPARKTAMDRLSADLKTKAPDLVEYVPEPPPPPPPPPPGQTTYEADAAVSPGDGLLPPPVTKAVTAPAPPPPPSVFDPAPEPVPVPVPAPVETSGDAPEKTTDSAKADDAKTEEKAPLPPPAEESTPPADSADKKSSENPKP